MGKNTNGYPFDAYRYTKTLQYQHPASRYGFSKKAGLLPNIAGRFAVNQALPNASE